MALQNPSSPQERMTLSIIIVSYNTKELLTDCLNSLKLATTDLKSETFVVDNNSQDGTPQMVAKNFSWVNLIKNEENLGFSKANNQALKVARGKYILILNPDTKVPKTTLSTMIDFMRNNKDVGMSTCKVEFPNGKLDIDCRRHFPTPWRSFCHFSGLSKLFKGSSLFDQYNYGYIPSDKQIDVDACVGAFMLTTREAIEKVGPFDEDFFFYGEDLDLCWRFHEKGYRIVFTPIAKIIHYKGASSGIKKTSQQVTKATKDSKKMVMAQTVKAMRIFYQKHYQAKYPFFINWLVYGGMFLMEKYRVNKV